MEPSGTGTVSARGTRRRITVALAGNPNSGKTTLFNALTGARHKVGNYPGVTVERREGKRVRGETEYRFVDLPGIYSLTAYSIDEVVARDFLLDEKPDLIVDVLDSSNLDRHLYLCLQFQELGLPVIGALNMSDEAEAKGIHIDEKSLAEVLGIPMVKTVGSKSRGIDALLDTVDLMASSNQEISKSIRYGDELESLLEPLEASIRGHQAFSGRFPARWLAVKLLEKDAHAIAILGEHPEGELIAASARKAVAWIERHYAKDAEIVVSEWRYGYVRGAVDETVTTAPRPGFSVTQAVDRVIMNRFLSLPLFLAVLWSVFQLTFSLGAFPMALLETGFSSLADILNATMAEGPLRSLLVDGIISGVGGVFSFVPLIVILFFLLSLLEDLGYMSRAAFATDKLLHSFGLHGQSVFPMMLGFGCSVPAIMAARTLKSPRDRIITVLVIPFMSCGAKLPVHVLLAAAFFPRNAASVVMIIYLIGVLLALGSAWLLSHTILRGNTTPFVMELPPYRAPTLRGLLWHVGEKTWQYVKKAGTVILASSVIIWAATVFPVYKPADLAADLASAGVEPGAGDRQQARLVLENSYAGRLGKALEPLFRPMGFDWRVAIATITGFAAKETVVSTLGVLYSTGDGEETEGESLRSALRADPGFSPLVAFALMLFILVIPPCFAALATIRAELGGTWLAFAIFYMLGVGWILATTVYQGGMLLGLGA